MDTAATGTSSKGLARLGNQRQRLGRLIASLSITLIASGSLLAHPAQAVPPAAQVTTVSPTMQTQVKAIVDNLAERSGPSDPRYLAADTFVDGTPECFRCTLGPAPLFAAYGVKYGDADAVNTATRVVDKAILTHQRADGAFTPAGPGEGGPDIQTVMTGNVIAETYLILGNKLDSAHQASWRSSLAKSADWLIKNGNLTWYTNGNINLADSINMDYTARITGEPRFKKAAADSLAFTLSPPPQWKNFGLHITRQPTAASGADGAAYLSESGSGGVGYDPVYTLFQTDMASTWYALTGDAQALRITNLLYNQMQPRVRPSDWTIDVGGGTRRPTPGVRYRFTSAALPVLATKGGRPELTSAMTSQLVATMGEYSSAANYSSPGMSYNFAVELTPVVLVLAAAPTPAPVKAACAPAGQ